MRCNRFPGRTGPLAISGASRVQGSLQRPSLPLWLGPPCKLPFVGCLCFTAFKHDRPRRWGTVSRACLDSQAPMIAAVLSVRLGLPRSDFNFVIAAVHCGSETFAFMSESQGSKAQGHKAKRRRESRGTCFEPPAGLSVRRDIAEIPRRRSPASGATSCKKK